MAESQEVEAQWKLELKDLPSLRRLGRGLSGYLYETTWGGEKCARKDFPLGSAERNRLFETEVKKVCKLDDHPDVVKCFGYTVGRSSCSLVQEYVADNLQRMISEEGIRNKGTGLSRVLDVGEIKHLLSSRAKEKEKGKGKVAGLGTFEAVSEAVDIISQIATGMRFLHENGVVHGDLKPRNVLLLDFESGVLKVKLADYGLTETKKRIRMVSERTRRAEILTWKAPECLGKKYLNHDDPFAESDTDSDEETVDDFFKSKLAMADVYSFGLTCAYVLGGKRMSPDMNLSQLRQQRMQGFKPKLTESASPEYLKFMILSCLEPEPLKRPTFSTICTDVLPRLSLPKLKDVMKGRGRGYLSWDDFGSSLLHLPSEVGLPSSLEARSVDSSEQINTLSVSSRAPREMSHSSITREIESVEIIQQISALSPSPMETETGIDRSPLNEPQIRGPQAGKKILKYTGMGLEGKLHGMEHEQRQKEREKEKQANEQHKEQMMESSEQKIRKESEPRLKEEWQALKEIDPFEEHRQQLKEARALWKEGELLLKLQTPSPKEEWELQLLQLLQAYALKEEGELLKKERQLLEYLMKEEGELSRKTMELPEEERLLWEAGEGITIAPGASTSTEGGEGSSVGGETTFGVFEGGEATIGVFEEEEGTTKEERLLWKEEMDLPLLQEERLLWKEEMDLPLLQEERLLWKEEMELPLLQEVRLSRKEETGLLPFLQLLVKDGRLLRKEETGLLPFLQLLMKEESERLKKRQLLEILEEREPLKKKQLLEILKEERELLKEHWQLLEFLRKKGPPLEERRELLKEKEELVNVQKQLLEFEDWRLRSNQWSLSKYNH